MKKHTIASLSIFFLLAAHILAHAQVERGSFGFGLSGGAQQIIGDAPKVRPAIGGEGHFTYRFTDRVSVNMAVGYKTFSYDISGMQQNKSTTLLSGNLVFDIELLRSGVVRPFIGWGIGAFSFQANNTGRFYDGEGILCLGSRFFVKSNIALFISALGKYTTGDDLDAIRQGGKDMYASVRAGFVWYKTKNRIVEVDNLFSDTIAPIEEYSDEAGTDEPRIDKLGESQFGALEQSRDLFGASVDTALEGEGEILEAEEVLTLQNRLEMLKEELEQKDREIARLKTELSKKNIQVTKLEMDAPQIEPQPRYDQRGEQRRRAIPVSTPTKRDRAAVSFHESYQNGRDYFESRQYFEAIQLFQELLLQKPEHRYASNCQYWIGESYFGMRDFESALDAFQKTLLYQKSYKKDDAMLMSGRCYLKLGQTAKAREAFLTLLEAFPDSEYRAKARQYLALTG